MLPLFGLLQYHLGNTSIVNIVKLFRLQNLQIDLFLMTKIPLQHVYFEQLLG